MKLSDEKLFEEFRKGSAEGFEELLNRYKGPLYTVILKRVRDPALAEDIFQETFKRVIEHADMFKRGKKFSPWVYRIAFNLCVDMHRKRQKRGEVGLDESRVESREESGIEEKVKGKEIKNLNNWLNCS